MARAKHDADLSGVRTGTDGEKPLLGARRRPRQVLVGGCMDGELYDKVAKLMLQGWDVDDAIKSGLFERSEIPEVYRLLERQQWGPITFEGNKPDYGWD